MTNIQKLDKISQDLRKARLFVNNKEKIFKGEFRELDSKEFKEILDYFKLTYKEIEFNTFTLFELIEEKGEN